MRRPNICENARQLNSVFSSFFTLFVLGCIFIKSSSVTFCPFHTLAILFGCPRTLFALCTMWPDWAILILFGPNFWTKVAKFLKHSFWTALVTFWQLMEDFVVLFSIIWSHCSCSYFYCCEIVSMKIFPCHRRRRCHWFTLVSKKLKFYCLIYFLTHLLL